MSVERTSDSSSYGETTTRALTIGSDNKLPVLLWGNGACANSMEEHKNFLNKIASHVYIVLGIGQFNQIQARDDSSRKTTQSSQLLKALDWMNVENGRDGSSYLGMVNTSMVSAMVKSCGGLQVIEISFDPQIKANIGPSKINSRSMKC